MRRILIKIAASLMALLVLFSTFSFTVEKHYCKGFLVDVSYIGKAGGCCIKTDTAIVYKKKNCCKSEVQQIEGQEALHQNPDLKVDVKKQQFLTAFFTSYKNLLIDKKSEGTNYKYSSPPDNLLDYQVLYQVFLI